MEADRGGGEAHGMTVAELDGMLAELAKVATTLLRESAVAERDRNTWSDAAEAFVEGPSGARRQPNPQRVLADVRSRVADATANALRRHSREVVAWWAHAATYAATTTAAGVATDPLMIAAADPTAFLDEDDLARLPAPAQEQRSLAVLAAHMAATPIHEEQPGEMARIAHDAAARAGMRLRLDDNGEPTLVDDHFPDARRHRMWGWYWSQLQLPALPRADELTAHLLAVDPPAPVIEEIRSAAAALEQTFAAELRLHELESDNPTNDDDPIDGADLDRLLAQVDRTTEVLADYARVVTTHLPALRRDPGPTQE